MKKALILLLGLSLCLTNGFADDIVIPEDIFDYPIIEGPEQIEGIPAFQRDPEVIFGSPDFEKMRNLPPDSQDYQLGRKVCWILIFDRITDEPLGSCTGFLVGPDLLMTNTHCLYDFDAGGRLRAGRVWIFMDYYQDPTVDPTAGGVTTGAIAILHADGPKDYALLRLNDPIGNTYGWLELDTTTEADTRQSVKIIQHPDGRSKEISRRNSQISDLLPDRRAARPFLLLYFADTEGGSSGSPVFLKDGTGVIAIHHSVQLDRQTRDPIVNSGSLMSYIVPEIQQYLPVTFNPATIEDQIFTANTFITPLTLPAATGGTAPYTYTLSPIPPGLAFNAASRSLSGTPTTAGITKATYTATGASGKTASLNFMVTVIAPITLNPATLGDQTFMANILITPLTLPAATGGTPPYTYTLSPIPPGLAFNAASRSLSGTPTTAGITKATYTAIDANRKTASLTFTVTVIGPIAFNPPTIPDQTFTVDTLITPLTLPRAIGGTPPYIYTLSPIPPGLAFNAASRSLSGTPTTIGTTKATYTATDASGQIPSLIFTITVIGPITFNPATIDDQTFTVDKPVTLTLPTATGGTPPYTYTLSPIPPGLAFVAEQHSLAGTPTTVGVTDLTYTATDATDAAATLNFTIEVIVDPLDVNSDGQVTVIDLAIVALFYGTQVQAGTLPADVNADGIVNILDLTAVAQGIDAIDVNLEELSLEAVAAALAAAAEQAAE